MKRARGARGDLEDDGGVVVKGLGQGAAERIVALLEQLVRAG